MKLKSAYCSIWERKFHQSGIISGRNKKGTNMELLTEEIKNVQPVILANNGSIIRRFENDELMERNYLNPLEFEKIYNEGLKLNLNPIVHVDEFLNGYDESEAKVRVEDKAMKQYSRRDGLIKQFFFGLIVIVLILWSGTYFGEIGGQEARNWIAAFVLAFFPLIDAFAPVTDSLKELPLYEDTVQRLSTLPDMSKEQVVEKELTIANSQIEFKAVDFSYGNEQKQLLKSLNLVIPEGEVLAVLGKSGVGKTTLSKLLRGDLEPNSGEILIGDVKSIELGRQKSEVIGVLNQQPHIFNTTIRNNIRLGNINATDEAVEAAAIQAGLGPVIQKLPQGLDTIVEESGKRFSGGEQQRIALARILLQDVPIIIIDEPTIGLDPLTEKQLLTTVFEVLKGKTVLWITHHLVGTRYADRIIFLEDGEISMEGSPKELLANNAKFKELYELDLYE